MDGWCRVCSRNDDFRRFPVFAVAEVSQEVIANMITSCTDTQVSSEDGLPQQICPDCLIALSLSFSFRKLCRRSDAKFRENYDGRTLLQPLDPNQRRSQSQLNDDNSFDAIPAIKEEVEFYDYECNLPPQEDQWVIQNPRTIGEGAMTVVHSSSQYYDEADDNGEQDASVVVPMATQNTSEFGECSGIGRKEEKWKKKPQTPERFSKRIRRQSDDFGDGEYATYESRELEVLKTSRGKDLLALEGYVFYKNSQRGNRCYWECKGRSRRSEGQIIPKCPARVTTDFFDNHHELLSYKGKHTHEPDQSHIQVIKQRNLLKECATSDNSKPEEIMRQVFDTVPHEQSNISKNALRKIIKRARMEEHPSETVTLDAIEVPLESLQTLSGAQFYQGDVQVENKRAFIFAGQLDLKNLAKATFWLAATTFTAKTGIQRQLLTIHSSLNPYHQQTYPAVYILVSASSESLYRHVFSKLKQLTEGLDSKLNPQLILTDFEQPLIKALETEFPHSRKTVCFFHLSHHLFRAIEHNGLSASLEKNHWLLQNYKRVKAMAFLPPEHIPDAYYVLKSNAPMELHPFLNDFGENYIFGKVVVAGIGSAPVRERPVFAPSFWSVHTSLMQSIPNTYSQTKEWHYRMTRLLTAHHGDPLRIFRAFQQEQQEADNKMTADLTGMGPSRVSEDHERHENIRTIATNFTSYSTLQFLDAIADNLDK